MTTTTATRAEQAQQVRDSYRAQVESLQAPDSPYHASARDDMIRELRTQANATIDALAAEERAALDAERTSLERDVFGPPALPLGATPSDRIVRDASYRDARERARATDHTMTGASDQLLALYRDARTLGDELQQKAALAVAMERGDVATLNAYTADHPALEAKVDRLYELRHRPDSMDTVMRFGMDFVGV